MSLWYSSSFSPSSLQLQPCRWCIPTTGTQLPMDMTHSEHGCHTHRNERLWTDKIIFDKVFAFQLLHLSN
ncbi:hypothetical protein TNIN_485651 [Trichonephila inaurata madagascariensis]|uniref:Uncharacterized protein n=1 Tax=Trichonephila inaurata madagascariensis TaxID=2747483 RepID=A0A8X7CCF8_9ARAC|nr:hypothetical protein TNIN_485651 [Trichonephila inaurata madagascariensis]